MFEFAYLEIEDSGHITFIQHDEFGVCWDTRPERLAEDSAFAGHADKLCSLFDLLLGTGVFAP